ncbi:MAG TPA: hypothetical protein VKG80_13845 [Trebonia sp.]|nr:hypothetical protein [Trebonia sp.]
MYYSYMLYQAEHPRTLREQREEDIRAGQLAAEFARLLRGLRLGPRREAPRPPRASGMVDTCRIPRPRTS